MCWQSKKYNKPEVADKDIHVYKICKFPHESGDYAIPYYMTAMERYKVGRIYKADSFNKPHNDGGCYTMNHGIHSYSPECRIERGYLGRAIKIKSFECNNFELDWYHTATPIVLMLCSIPKGELYYLNEDGEYVSQRIRVDSFVKIKITKAMRPINKTLAEWNNVF